MKSLFIAAAAILMLASSPVFAGEAVKETTITVSGNCEQCKTRIEKAMKIPQVRFAKWNKKSKELFVAYFDQKITVDSLQRRLASVGHDNGPYKSSDDVYRELPSCCKYRDNAVTH